jgi:iron complex transport system substrate-binding protein
MKRVWLIVLTVMILALVGCQAPAKVAEAPQVTEVGTEVVQETTESLSVVYPLTYTDGTGKQVVIEKEPKRIISLTPSITETIFSLGAESRLVGRTDWCVYPEATTGIESIGTLQEPNIEAIVALNPDLIMVSTLSNDETRVKLEELGLTVVMISGQESFDGLYQVITDMGQILNTTDEASTLVEGLKGRVATTLEKVKDVTRPTVYYAVAFGEYGEYTAGGDTFIHQMIEMAGGDNIAKEISGWSYSLEQMVEKDPEIVIVSTKWDAKMLFTSGDNYKQLSAVKNGKVVEVNEDLVQIQGPRLVDGLEALVKVIHPEIQ